MQIRKKIKKISFPVVVVGGGMAGLCAAVASARQGVRTILVQDRPVLGGNASSEIRMHICGASGDMAKKNVEETGILYELMLANKKYNTSFNYSIWSTVLWNATREEKNLTTLLNCSMHSVDVEDDLVKRISCYQGTTETEWVIEGRCFIDGTGNGTLGYFCGAEYRIGSESRKETGEPHAPEEPNNDRMGNTLLFKARDTGHPVKFATPPWAWHFTEEQLKYRNHAPLFHADTKDVLKILDQGDSGNGRKYTEAPCIDYGYWWIELTGKSKDIIDDYETIRDDLLGIVYGVWDHLKNGNNHGAANYELEWVGMLPGVRESRRFVGDYLLNEQDILANKIFPDAVAYGGWPIDAHCPHGLLDYDKVPSFVYSFPGIYSIPYRSYYSRNIKNLFLVGRIISATKLGMASSRVMGTCAIGGQAVGTAAALCVSYGCSPRELGERHMDHLQQLLLKDDCYIPGCRNHDPKDFARKALLSASSGNESLGNLVNGVTRPVGNDSNAWDSSPIGVISPWIDLKLDRPRKVKELRLTFATDLSRPIKITMSSKRQALQQKGVPQDLVKDYEVILFLGKKEVARFEKRDNFQRLNVCRFDFVLCDEVRIQFLSTNGAEKVCIYECRLY